MRVSVLDSPLLLLLEEIGRNRSASFPSLRAVLLSKPFTGELCQYLLRILLVVLGKRFVEMTVPCL